MRPFLVKPAAYVKGKIVLSGDKSIAHRAILIAAITPAKTKIKNFPANQDCLSTAKTIEKLGVKIIYNLNKNKDKLPSITIFGVGLYGLNRPDGPIFIRDSGTTLRLILGILAGQNFKVILTAGKSLSKRPMLRVTAPLRMMGAEIKAKVEEYPPITIRGGKLKPVTYKMPVASAQVKSAILLAGLYAKGLTRVIEPLKTRDHTERMLKLFKADIKLKYNQILIRGNRELISPGIVTIPGDISSASFFIVLASILPDSKILLRSVGLNPSRIGVIKVFERMGADIKSQKSLPVRQAGKVKSQNYEPIGNLLVKSSILKGTIVKKEEVPFLIDELPVLMVAACFAKGKTIFEGVQELRVKETDRINSMLQNLNRMGADIQVNKTAKSEKIIIKGVKELRGAPVRSFADHRTAMSMVVAGLVAKGNSKIDDISCINKSFPNFLGILKKIIH